MILPAVRPALRRSAFVGVSLAAAAAFCVPVADAAAHHDSATGPKPTVVFVHGAFADSAGWYGAMDRLRGDGYPVRAASNPLRGLTSDSAYVRQFIDSIKGPIILVGHSYGGGVISEAAAGDPNVKALVYVAALVPDTGETIGDLTARPVAHPVPPLPLQQVAVTQPDGTPGTDLYIDPAQFRETFAADVNPVQAADMADAQEPANSETTTEPATAAAWRSIPSWYLVAKQDHALSPDLERWMAQRAGAHTVEVNSSHAVMVSHPAAVANLVEQADQGTR
ncbi:alpha/beta fold hydrolase [Actinacidiphila acididurans]|uniref:alpha/beta fold hydrolase n=1 Tax=Actinacidiphila acididurans TaxID=2784346 RepID=UPI0027DC38CC|nr:alpha/beta hydrolase [Actinacidiphila acididurans]